MAIWTRRRERRGVTLGGVHLGEHPWLVLGGGGLKGLAHIGVCSSLEEAGFVPSGILGTSIGALVGACLSGGRSVAELTAAAQTLTRADIARVQRRALWMNGVRAASVFHGEALRDYLGRVLPSQGWEKMSIRFQANAVELGHGRTEWFGVGARTDVSLVDAVYASSALPLFYPPALLPGGIYVDGGVEDALPIRRAAELGATGIVAVDVGAGERANAARIVDMGILAVHERIFSIMAGRRRREIVAHWHGPPLLYIRPELDDYGGFDFDRIQTFIRLGREAAGALLGLPGPTGATRGRAPAEVDPPSPGQLPPRGGPASEVRGRPTP